MMLTNFPDCIDHVYVAELKNLNCAVCGVGGRGNGENSILYYTLIENKANAPVAYHIFKFWDKNVPIQALVKDRLLKLKLQT